MQLNFVNLGQIVLKDVPYLVGTWYISVRKYK